MPPTVNGLGARDLQQRTKFKFKFNQNPQAGAGLVHLAKGFYREGNDALAVREGNDALAVPVLNIRARVIPTISFH